MLKIKKNILKSLSKIKTEEVVLYFMIFSLGVVSPFARYDSVAFVGVSIIILLSFSKLETTLVYAVGSFISLGYMSIENGYYLAYFMAVGIYSVTYAWFYSKKMSMIISAIVFIAFKIALFYSSISFTYQILFVVECILFLIIPYNLKLGFSNLKNAKTLSSIEDYINNFLALCIFAVSFSAIFDNYIYFDVAVLLSIAIYFSNYQKFDLAFISLLAISVVLTFRGDFYIYFISIIAIYFIASLSFKKKWWLMYILAGAIACVINIVLIGLFSDLTLLFITFTSLIIHFFMHKYIKLDIIELDDMNEKTQKDFYKLTSNLNKLQKSLSFLGNTIIDITKLNEKTFKEEPLFDLVAEDVCRKCKNNMYCWAQNYTNTQDELVKYSNNLTLKNEAEFSEWFYSSCVKVEKIKKSFEENQRLMLTKRYIKQSQKNNQRLLQTAFLSVSHIIADIEIESQKGYNYNSKITFEMDKFLRLLDVKSNFSLANRNPDSFILASLNEIDSKTLYKIKAKLEILYNKKFENYNLEMRGNEFVYTFLSKRNFEFEIFYESKGLDTICGDECETFEDNQKVYLVLSDGMGTGVFAAKESKTTIAMAKSLLKAQIDVLKVVEIVNLALNLKSSGDVGASIDILVVDKYTGKATLTKAGASESAILNSKGMERIYKDSLPLGILKDTKLFQYEFNLKDKDTIVLVSDGARIENNLRSMYDFSCEKIVSSIMKTSSKDDKTVAALKLIKTH